MTYEQRVRAYEAEGMTRSDAQGIVDLEDMRTAKNGDTMSTYTKGPWIAGQQNPASNTIPIKAGKSTLAHCEPRPHWDDTQVANARLIAAAPELLEACKRAKSLLEPELIREPDRTIFWELVSAITKAEGRA